MQQAKYILFVHAFTSIVLAAFGQSAGYRPAITVNQQRIENRIVELSKFGKDSSGHGYRLAFSQGDIDARNWFIVQMRKAGLEVSIDYAGNIVGMRKGQNPALPAIAFGSHIDMVPDGGNYDGCVGAVGALEVMQVLQENNILTNHPLQLIITADEEGSMVGSQALAGNFTLSQLKNRSQFGLTVGEGIKAIGGNPDSIEVATIPKGAWAAFIELHVEQGGILEKEKIQVGIVQGIVGIADWDITIRGMANHAGTTPMHLRQDALLAAARLIIAVNEVINGAAGNQVGSIGKITAWPGAYNVVPGKVVLGMEIRDLSYKKIQELYSMVEKSAAKIAAATGTVITFSNRPPDAMPALTDSAVQNIIMQAAKALGFTYKYLPSGAGHDAQNMALIAPTGMIFVPSAGGISHAPQEYTSAADMANGANVLLQTILALDKK
ncbi:MAG TPA: M20 family metallo-hydrolase [Ferruginibacter sp.]|nr:M20 family metallo-hydrolase [Ferruginibacter sp.]HMP22123.1 M20 family metallo-hydrolase [Ferruginibacter sp.]